MKYSDALWDILKEIDDVSDPTFEFLAGCFSYCLTNDGLTKKQSKIVDKYINKYGYLWADENPDQNPEYNPDHNPEDNLDDNPKGGKYAIN